MARLPARAASTPATIRFRASSTLILSQVRNRVTFPARVDEQRRHRQIESFDAGGSAAIETRPERKLGFLVASF